jgi:hypothetical protein
MAAYEYGSQQRLTALHVLFHLHGTAPDALWPLTHLGEVPELLGQQQLPQTWLH